MKGVEDLMMGAVTISATVVIAVYMATMFHLKIDMAASYSKGSVQPYQYLHTITQYVVEDHSVQEYLTEALKQNSNTAFGKDVGKLLENEFNTSFKLLNGTGYVIAQTSSIIGSEMAVWAVPPNGKLVMYYDI